MQGYNRYYPPDYDGKSSLNQLAGKHGLGKRAHKTSEGILVVRFELPFNIYCDSCNAQIAQGVRFNAEKQKVGNYYSTPILRFSFKCHLCAHKIAIETDPQNTAYKVSFGAHEAHGQPDEANGRIEIKPLHEKTVDNEQEDPVSLAEKEAEEKSIQEARNEAIKALYESNQQKWEDVHGQSQKLRKRFRKEKHEIRIQDKEKKELQDKHSLNIRIVSEDDNDKLTAHSVEFGISSGFNADSDLKASLERAKRSKISLQAKDSSKITKHSTGKKFAISKILSVVDNSPEILPETSTRKRTRPSKKQNTLVAYDSN